jgi:DNA-binding transcriptional ArsR family regulator
MNTLFGSQLRTDTLVAIGRLGETYISELARLLGRRPIEIRRAVASLESAGAVLTRRLGNVRIVELSRLFPEHEQLADLLLSMSERPLYAKRWRPVRKRPRAIGKAM